MKFKRFIPLIVILLLLITTNVSAYAALRISKIYDIKYTMHLGDKFSLPKSVTAIMSNKAKQTVAVTWNAKTVNTSVTGTHTYLGTVKGYAKKVKLIVVIIKPASGLKWNVYKPLPKGIYCSGFAYGNGVYAAVVNFVSNYKTTSSVIYTSKDLVKWNPTNKKIAEYYNITFANGYFFLFKNNDLQKSSDCINWETVDLKVIQETKNSFDDYTKKVMCHDDDYIKNIVYINNQYILYTAYDNLIFTSKDTVNWNFASMIKPPIGVPYYNKMQDLAYGNGHYIAAAMDYIYESDDLINWKRTSVESLFKSSIWCQNIKFVNNIFVGIADVNAIMVSNDGGNTWVETRLGKYDENNYIINIFAYKNNFFIKFENGDIYQSGNGLKWSLIGKVPNRGHSSYIINDMFVDINGSIFSGTPTFSVTNLSKIKILP